MAEIIPAILPKDFSELEEKMGIVAGHVAHVHIDVTNGTMTPDSTWPYSGESAEFLKIVEEVEGFPHWQETGFEAHLMVNDPENLIEEWIRVGAERIILQYESFGDPHTLTQTLVALKNKFKSEASYLGVEAGLAVNLDTPLESIYPYVDHADFVQFMSIAEIGKQGNPFDERIFERIKIFKDKFPEKLVSVDGGVHSSNIDELVEAGADRLVVGSAIFADEHPEAALEELREISQ
jgi:ribulose-phosphate 3-epimerase